MKILVVSDTHRDIDGILKAVERMEVLPQLIIHLGDYAEDGESIEKNTGIKVEIVRGNGDFFNKNYEDDKVIEVKGKKIFLTHGHKYNVRYGVMNLSYKAKELNADIALYGHTHVPLIIKDSDIMIMNPGSPSYPRGLDRARTYGLIEIEDRVNMKIEKI